MGRGIRKFVNNEHNHGHNKHFDQDALLAYDHFHEEYDLDHGDHVHHIEPHSSHDHNEEYLFYTEDYFEDDKHLNKSDHLKIMNSETQRLTNSSHNYSSNYNETNSGPGHDHHLEYEQNIDHEHNDHHVDHDHHEHHKENDHHDHEHHVEHDHHEQNWDHDRNHDLDNHQAHAN